MIENVTCVYGIWKNNDYDLSKTTINVIHRHNITALKFAAIILYIPKHGTLQGNFEAFEDLISETST